MFSVKEINVKSVMTKSNFPFTDYSLNPYIGCTHGCKYCYASFMKRFTNHPEPWGEFVDVKYREPIKDFEKYKGKKAFLGTVCDPYQPLELKYERTRELLKQLQGSGISLSISTRSDLILRDIDLIKTFPGVRVSFSINTTDEEFKKDMDRGASIEKRFEAMKKLYDEGIITICFISPIFPGITDIFNIIEKAKDRCNLVWLENLNLRGDFKQRILDYIHDKHPELDGLYHDIYSKGDNTYWKELDKEISEYARKNGYNYLPADDKEISNHGELPRILNCFYHENLKKGNKKETLKFSVYFLTIS